MASSAPNALNTRAQPQPIDRLFAMPTMRPRFPCSRGALATGMGMRVASSWVRPSRRRATQTRRCSRRTIASEQVKPMRYHPIFVVLLLMIWSGGVQAADRLTRECEFEAKARYGFGKERNDDARM